MKDVTLGGAPKARNCPIKVSSGVAAGIKTSAPALVVYGIVGRVSVTSSRPLKLRNILLMLIELAVGECRVNRDVLGRRGQETIEREGVGDDRTSL